MIFYIMPIYFSSLSALLLCQNVNFSRSFIITTKNGQNPALKKKRLPLPHTDMERFVWINREMFGRVEMRHVHQQTHKPNRDRHEHSETVGQNLQGCKRVQNR